MRNGIRALCLLAASWLMVGVEATPLRQGELAPEYLGQTLDDKRLELADYRGRVVVLSYWASWCPYCLKELPVLHGLQQVAGRERLQVIAVNTETRDVFRKLQRALKGLDVQLGYDPDHHARQAYGVKGLPHLVIIDREGRIDSIHRGYGEESLDRIVAAVNRASGLSSAAPAAKSTNDTAPAALPSATSSPELAPNEDRQH